MTAPFNSRGANIKSNKWLGITVHLTDGWSHRPWNQLPPCFNGHVHGNSKDVDREDWQRNDASIADGSLIISAYQTPTGRIWIITEADRGATKGP